ncbi:basic amino acid ABC transporter substrate-binding protein [Halobacterium litoreum]|uniref:Basic amino acid ABC transporter substrate-binding protein n=1 Tax=Halobacterium litoreum TaxID=2039234 RepID=A0ABD5NDC3_9EURY|nr:basic amino acid ABC transporter substrate-binding protein [Halobacterium litoreum]UHH14042.1 basic amino acid ABC transporter substrate-binding protein [Halobacterium litoreum]
MTDISRRTYLKSVGGTGVALSVAGCSSILGGGSAGTIVPGTASGFPPFEFVNEQGELVGFDVDLLTAVVDETDYELGEWSDLNFDTLITALQNDQIDTIAAAMTITEGRDETIDFTDPYYDANQAVLVRENSDFRPSGTGDLADRPIGAQSGTTGESEMQALVEEGVVSESQTTAYENYVLAVQDLVNGNVDAVIVDTPVAETFVADRPVVSAFTIETGEQYGFGVRTNDDDRQQALNEGLQAVMDDGTYEELTRKWFASE